MFQRKDKIGSHGAQIRVHKSKVVVGKSFSARTARCDISRQTDEHRASKRARESVCVGETGGEGGLTFLSIMENKTPPMVMHTMKDEKISPVGRTPSLRTPCRVGTHMKTVARVLGARNRKEAAAAGERK